MATFSPEHDEGLALDSVKRFNRIAEIDHDMPEWYAVWLASVGAMDSAGHFQDVGSGVVKGTIDESIGRLASVTGKLVELDAE